VGLLLHQYCPNWLALREEILTQQQLLQLALLQLAQS